MAENVPMAAIEKKKCVVCDSEISRTEKLLCPVCLSDPDGTKCVNCQKRIPTDAKMCAICKTYQRWWRFFSEVAAALPVVAIIAAASGIYTVGSYLYYRNSHTNFKFVSANANVVYLTVWNAGQKPSALLGGRLSFDDLDIDDVQLNLPDIDVRDGRIVIQKDDRATVALTVPPFLGLHNKKQAYITKQEVEGQIKSHRVTLYLNVDESNGNVASPHESLTGDRVLTFVTGRMYK